MTKVKKIVMTICLSVLCAALVVATCLLTACGGGTKSYTLHTRAIDTDDYIDYEGDIPFLLNHGNGLAEEEHGMTCFEGTWAGGKMAQSDDGDLYGYGISYDFKLDVTDSETEGKELDYVFYFSVNCIGNGTSYTGEGVCTWAWQGYAESVSGGYKLEAPLKCDVECTGTLAAVVSSTNFANIPSAGYTAWNYGGDNYGSNNPDENEYADFGVKPQYALEYFYGCTVTVSGKNIKGFTDVNYFSE